jgi:hypothetical protein
MRVIDPAKFRNHHPSFLACLPEVRKLMIDGHTKYHIWEEFLRNGKISMKYRHFTNYTIKYCADICPLRAKQKTPKPA